jgi:predicted transcriptional regulator
LVSKSDYFQNHVKSIITNFFHGSASEFALFFANDQLDLSELEEIQRMIDEKIKKMKTKK